MWPDWASRQLEISPWTLTSVKFFARRSRIFPVNSLTVKVLRLGMRLKLSCWVMRGCRVNSWLGGEFLWNRIIGALFIPKNAYDPPPLAIVRQLKAVDATGEGRFTRSVPGFVTAKDMGDVAKGLNAADDRTFEKTMLGKVNAGAGDILLDGARANVNITFAVLSGRGEGGAGQKQRTKTIPVAVASTTRDHTINGSQDAIGGFDILRFGGRDLGRGIWGRIDRCLLSCRLRRRGGLRSRSEIEK